MAFSSPSPIIDVTTMAQDDLQVPTTGIVILDHNSDTHYEPNSVPMLYVESNTRIRTASASHLDPAVLRSLQQLNSTGVSGNLVGASCTFDVVCSCASEDENSKLLPGTVASVSSSCFSNSTNRLPPRVFSEMYGTCLRRLVSAALAGRHALGLSFGPMDPQAPYKTSLFLSNSDSGDIVLGCILNDLFSELHRLPNTTEVAVSISAFELLHERSRDLLSEATFNSSASNAVAGFFDRKVRFHSELGNYLEGVSRIPIACVEDARHLLRVLGQRNVPLPSRHSSKSSLHGSASPVSGSPQLLASSSDAMMMFHPASHVIVQVHVRLRDMEAGVLRSSILSLVDVGADVTSMPFASLSGAPSNGRFANLSLRMLRRIVELSAQIKPNKQSAESTRSRLPTKDSVLTWLLSEPLVGNGVVSAVCALQRFEPSSEYGAESLSHAATMWKLTYEENLKIIRFATQLKQMRLAPRINEEKCDVVVHVIQQEISLMRRKLGQDSMDPEVEGFNRLQQELSLKAEQLLDEQSRKTQVREALHSQVKQTAEELDTLRRELHEKQLAAARTKSIEEELQRISNEREAALQRLAEVRAAQRRTELRLLKAKRMVQVAEEMKEEREQKEVVARKDEASRSTRVFRNVFLTATAIGRDRQLRNTIENHNQQLKERISDVQWRLQNVKKRHVEASDALNELRRFESSLQLSLSHLETASLDLQRSEEQAIVEMEQTTANARLKIALVAVSNQEPIAPVVTTTSGETKTATTSHRPEQRSVLSMDDAYDAEYWPLRTEMEAIDVRQAQLDAAIQRLERTLVRRHAEEAMRAEQSPLVATLEQSQLVRDQSEGLKRDIRDTEREISFLQLQINSCSAAVAQMQEDAMVVKTTRQDSPTKPPDLLSPSDPSHSARKSPSLSRSFAAQKHAVESSVTFRRFVL